jgi:hypothetical protein
LTPTAKGPRPRKLAGSGAAVVVGASVVVGAVVSGVSATVVVSAALDSVGSPPVGAGASELSELELHAADNVTAAAIPASRRRAGWRSIAASYGVAHVGADLDATIGAIGRAGCRIREQVAPVDSVPEATAIRWR